jgi:hypothetical protein
MYAFKDSMWWVEGEIFWVYMGSERAQIKKSLQPAICVVHLTSVPDPDSSVLRPKVRQQLLVLSMQRRREPAGGLGKKERNRCDSVSWRLAGALLLLGWEWHLRSEPPDPEEWARQRVTVARQPLRALKWRETSLCCGPRIRSRGLPAEATTAFHWHRQSLFPLSGSP